MSYGNNVLLSITGCKAGQILNRDYDCCVLVSSYTISRRLILDSLETATDHIYYSVQCVYSKTLLDQINGYHGLKNVTQILCFLKGQMESRDTSRLGARELPYFWSLRFFEKSPHDGDPTSDRLS